MTGVLFLGWSRSSFFSDQRRAQPVKNERRLSFAEIRGEIISYRAPSTQTVPIPASYDAQN